MDRAGSVIEENIDACRTGLLYGCSKIGPLAIVNGHVESDVTAPFQFTVVASDRHGTASGQFGDLTDELPDRSRCCGYDDRIAGPRPPDLGKTQESRNARTAPPGEHERKPAVPAAPAPNGNFQ